MEYRIKPEYFERLKKKMLSWYVPILAVVFIIISITQGYNPKTKEFDFVTLAIVLPIFILFGGYSYFRMIKRQRVICNSYRIIIHDNLITREQANTPTISIYANEISSMIKSVDNHIIIKGKTAADLIYVPSKMENFEELERKLEEFMLIVPATKKTFLQRYQIVISLLVLALMITTFATTNKIVAVICGLPLMVLLIYGYFQGIKNKNLDNRTRRGLWYMWILIAAIAGSIIYKMLNF
jgi:hypothetical protein